MQRGMEVNIIIYLSLYKVYVGNVLERYPDLHQEISNKTNQLSTDINAMDLDSAKSVLNQKLSSKFLVYLMNLSINKHCICICICIVSVLQDFCNKNQVTTEDYSQHYQMTGLNREPPAMLKR